MSETPLSYARSIAYIGDASTIRVLTLRMHGRAPRLETCQRIVSDRRAKFDLFRSNVAAVVRQPGRGRGNQNAG